MDWNRIEGNWKQFSGSVERNGASSPMTIWPPSTAVVTSSKAKSKSGMGLQRIKFAKMSTTGSGCCL